MWKQISNGFMKPTKARIIRINVHNKPFPTGWEYMAIHTRGLFPVWEVKKGYPYKTLNLNRWQAWKFLFMYNFFRKYLPGTTWPGMNKTCHHRIIKVTQPIEIWK